MSSDAPQTQVFTVIIRWSPESDIRATEGDIKEIVEQLVTETDEDATVEVEENLEHGM
jgi:hypothetical protein